MEAQRQKELAAEAAALEEERGHLLGLPEDTQSELLELLQLIQAQAAPGSPCDQFGGISMGELSCEAFVATIEELCAEPAPGYEQQHVTIGMITRPACERMYDVLAGSAAEREDEDGYLADWTLVSAIELLELLADSLAAKEREAVASAAAGIIDVRTRQAFERLAGPGGGLDMEGFRRYCRRLDCKLKREEVEVASAMGGDAIHCSCMSRWNDVSGRTD